jgi:hypothetical protein
LDGAIAEHGKINLLVVIKEFVFKGLEAAKADFKFGTQQYRQVSKAAFISKVKWCEWAIKVLDPITRRTDKKSFEPDQLEESWVWLCSE